MDGHAQKLIGYMDGADKRFVIPVYQRKYDWRIENCKRLFDDLKKIAESDQTSHFFGSIVSVHDDGAYAQFLVIDGQQRLTTVSLLFLAMYKLMKEKKLVPEQRSLPGKIYKSYLIDEYQEDELFVKLRSVEKDRLAYQKLFEDDPSEYVASSRLTINYQYFYDRLQKEEVSVDKLYEAICKLVIINITLNKDDDPQLIFESLNSTGLALSESDKIRNFILMGLPVKEQNAYFKNYWEKIEELTGDKLSLFIRDYLSIKLQSITTMSRVYFVFKQYVEDNRLETEPLLQELLRYAKWYQILLNGGTKSKKISFCIERLNRLETVVARPFLLEVLRLNAENQLTLAETEQIFQMVENYSFRRMICDLPTNALNKIFLFLHKEILRYDGTAANYVEKFKYALSTKKEKARFPEDDEFTLAISQRPVYQMNSKNKFYLLERLENANTLEDKSVYDHLDSGDYSIEHIMPQHLTPAWQKALGADYEAIHDTWLHRLANLTLVAVPYNSKYSNYAFADKRDMEHGFKDSGLRMNQMISQKKKWTLTELEERDRLLQKTALKIWAYPVTSYTPATKEADSYGLDEDVEFTGKEITKFRFKGLEQPVTSWIDMFERVLKILHAEDRSVLASLAVSSDGEISSYVSHNSSDLRSALEIEPGLYVEKNTSTSMKLSVLRKLFKLYGANETDLVFYIKDENETAESKQETARYALRRRYWDYAIPVIQEAHKDTGCFENWTTTKNNWICGFFGIGGFCISAVANYDEVRVELTLSSSKKEKNKAAFDALYQQKISIENTLGVSLNWQKGENTKSSLVTYSLKGIGIANEANWTQMAKFQAKWSKRFYDVFVPLLTDFNNILNNSN